MSLIVFPFKEEDPAVATANVRIAAAHPRVREILCVGSGPDAAYRAIAAAADEIEAATGVPVNLVLQSRLGTRRPGKGDAMNTGLAWFVDHGGFERLHFYDADITSFSGSWITRAEEAADAGYPVVRHAFPRASTDAMITWFMTRPGLAKLWPGTVLPRIQQPLGGELLLTREVVKHLVGDPMVGERSDWGIDTALTLSAAAAGFPIAEVSIPEGKLHKLYGSLTDIEDMALECFSAIQEAAGLVVPEGVDHRPPDDAPVSDDVRTKVAYSVSDTIGLLRDGWTDRQVDLLDLFPARVRRSMLDGREYPRLGFFDADLWGASYDVALASFDLTDRDWRRLWFRLWVARVLSYTVTECLKGYDAAIGYLRSTIAAYEAA